MRAGMPPISQPGHRARTVHLLEDPPGRDTAQGRSTARCWAPLGVLVDSSLILITLPACVSEHPNYYNDKLLLLGRGRCCWWC